ncbi:S8 family serine peptidase [Amycolatopsis rhabdoformis]|uniref:S8 family serine peptidase n=1 Tax=Amycolatopsis rhabdoformis TaxID=1448059 RepID=A0ABZ1HXC3_9PSEU|nr:S8 family serine peptidase [Amycolatopsis rhabdoformis]WSE26791.1 S8 family serine peptidase [Amycolatopsis rhabdoformis]
MRTSRKRRATATAACLAPLLASLVVAGPASAAEAPRPADGTHTVTLITGDVVTVNSDSSTISVKGPDGGPADARILQSAGDVFVFPYSAASYVAKGTLDRRLFNVTDLIADGYDDAHRDSLPLIVSYTAPPAGLRANVAPRGSALVRPLASVDGAAVTENHAQARDFWAGVTAGASFSPAPSFASGIKQIWLDGRAYADLADSVAQIGAPEVWAGGDTGQGVDVAVLDTGVDEGHPDLAGRIVDTRSFVAGEDIKDVHGHGTHVASTIAGTGAASGGTEKGVAPGARLHIGKVLANSGSGSDSDILAGMEWAAVDEHAKIINMSLGTQEASDGTDPMSQAVNNLSAQTGALFVIAAGNTSGAGTIGSPGAADAALTVGAVDSGDEVADFSSQGPRVGDGALKPEITAPGVDILAARSQYTSEGSGFYQTMSGTSMSTPHVVGAAALLAAKHPELTGTQLKDLLTSTSKQTPEYTAFQAGSGRVDAAAATQASVFATATAYAAQNEGGPVQRPVTYTNLGATPVDLALSVSASGAPAGMFKLSGNRVTVPAHGTASVTVTIDPRTAPAKSVGFTAQILATGPAGGVAAHTAVSLGALSHQMTITVKDSAGKPASALVVLLRAGDPNPALLAIDGSTTFFTPDDQYSALGYLTVPGTHGPSSQGLALLGDPDVDFTADRTITLDASHVRLVDETTPQPGVPTYLRLEYSRMLNPDGRWHDFGLADTGFDSLWVQPQEKVTHGDFILGARWRKEQPPLSVSVRGTDYTDVLRQNGVTALPTGTRTLPLVFAGTGTPADFTGVRGKAVVVRRSDAITPVALAKAAADAGVKLLLVANDQPGRQQLNFGTDSLNPSKIDVALLSADEGTKLINQARQRNAEVRTESHPAASYVYDLEHTWHNDVPKDMVAHATNKNLARIDETFAGSVPKTGAEEWRYDFPSYTEWGIGNYVTMAPSSHRTDWVTTDGANRWGHEMTDGVLNSWGVRRSYTPGSVSSDEWFTPVQRPYLSNNYLGPTRTDNQFRVDVPGYGNADHVGSLQDFQVANQTTTLYQGDQQLGTASDGLIMYATAPSERKQYRLVVANQRAASVNQYSSSSTTEWTFTSAAPKVAGEQDLLPLLQIQYGLPTDGSGAVARDAKFGIAVEQRSPVSVGLTDVAVAGAGSLRTPRVEVSYDDGATWTRLSQDRRGSYELDAPRKAKFASLRVTANDSAGNSVVQTVIRAVGVR